MKKIAPCAVLLAFALAFVGCNNQDEKPESLQDVLKDGGEVNLDEYDDFSSSGTYTISKDTTITGKANGANFTVTDGANVTFKNTGNIGKVMVKDSGSEIILEGDNVAVATVTAFANCTISSKSDNSIENVVVGADVTKLEIKGKTTVEKLALESSTAKPTITISEDVKITKAEDAAMDTIKTPAGTSASGQVEGTLTDKEKEEVKGELQESSGNNFIKSKEDLNKCVRNIIKKYYDFANGVDKKKSRAARAAAATTDDISKQLIDAFNAVYKPFYDDEELGKSFLKLFMGEGATTNINFESKIDLPNVGVNNGLDAFIDFANYAQDYFPSYEDDDDEMPGYDTTVRKAADSEKITRESWFGSNLDTVNAFLNVADKYASIPKLYLLGKLNVNDTATGNADYASATAKADIQIEAKNINDMIPKLFKVYSSKVEEIEYPSSANLPVTAIKPFINVDANVALTKGQYDKFVETCKDMPEREDFYYEASCPKYPNSPQHPFSYPEPDYNYTNEEWQQYWEKRNAAQREFEENNPELMEQYRQAMEQWEKDYEQYRKESDAFDWSAYWDGYDAAWDAWYDSHREEIKKYFLTAKYDSKACSCKVNIGISTTVTSTAAAPGGIITLSLEGNYTDPGKIIALMQGPISSGYVDILKELEKDFGIVPTVTVTDYNGSQTLKLSGLNDILGIITDIVDNIGEIIQD